MSSYVQEADIVMPSSEGSNLDQQILSRSVATMGNQSGRDADGAVVSSAPPKEPPTSAEAPRSRPLPIPLARPIVTQLLVGINVVIWLIVSIYAVVHYNGNLSSVLSGDSHSLLLALRDFGLLSNGCIASPDVAALYQLDTGCVGGNQWWRLFTAMFLHIGLLHVALNCVALYIFGRQAEQLYGRVRFLIIYLLAGLAGSLMSMGAVPALERESAGASGAIYGVIGLLLAYYFRYRHVLGAPGRTQLYNILLVAGLNFFLSSQVRGIDSWAHFGGFLGGAVLGLLLAPNYQVVENVQQGRQLVDKVRPALQVGVLIFYVFALGLFFAFGWQRLGTAGLRGVAGYGCDGRSA